MQTKEKVSKVTRPTEPLPYNEWVEKYNFGRGYTAPTPYFLGNEFDTRRFGKESPIRELSWQNFLSAPKFLIYKIHSFIW